MAESSDYAGDEAEEIAHGLKRLWWAEFKRESRAIGRIAGMRACRQIQ